jgi:hypothetical protein
MDITKDELIEILYDIPHSGLADLLNEMKDKIRVKDDSNWLYLNIDKSLFNKYVDDDVKDRNHIKYIISRHKDYYDRENIRINTKTIEYNIVIVFLESLGKIQLDYDSMVKELKYNHNFYAHRKDWDHSRYIYYTDLHDGEGLYTPGHKMGLPIIKYKPSKEDKMAEDWYISKFKGWGN